MCTPCCSNGDDQELKVSVTDQMVSSAPALTEGAKPPPEVNLMGQASRPAPGPSSRIFEAELVLNGRPHGLDIEAADEEFAIVKDVAGVAAEWTAKGDASEVIKPFDKVLEINGEEYKGRASAAFHKMAEEGAGTIKLKLQHAVERTVVFEKPGQLGMTINYKKSSVGIWVASVEAGLLSQWNQDHPDQVISPHDRIIQVNEIGGDSNAIVQKLRDVKNAEKSTLTVMSYTL
eukprot:TRINITY_DN15238_c0_g5_i1.p1 TRINITY_DN15238_c0_g5~~TRINITY_DN15238_c0_g5_i1.p1  ORF type:complete len:259 (+),score=52.77 TRINITY_DN15238_c0_g5_i1:84-779(+)